MPAPQDAGAVGRRGAHQHQRQADRHPRGDGKPSQIEDPAASRSPLQDLRPDSRDRLGAQRLHLSRGVRQDGGARFERVGIDVALAPPHGIL
jgi:hypothetical protein